MDTGRLEPSRLPSDSYRALTPRSQGALEAPEALIVTSGIHLTHEAEGWSTPGGPHPMREPAVSCLSREADALYRALTPGSRGALEAPEALYVTSKTHLALWVEGWSVWGGK